jgi:hypothetical protein
MEFKSRTVELRIGYRDKAGAVHRRVTFGKRIDGKTLFAIDNDPQSRIPTQHSDLIMRAAITEFGGLSTPVNLKALLELDSVDRDALAEEFNRFMTEGLGDGAVEVLSQDEVKLAVGYESNGLRYDVVRFGKHLTGMDEIEADVLKLTGLRRVCFLAGKQVTQFSQSDGASVLDGPMALDVFEKLDSMDVGVIQAAGELYRNSFRRIADRAREIGAGEKSAAAR